MKEFLNNLPWGFTVLLCATMGLAPFNPPHVYEKIMLLVQGILVRPLDWFDLVMHGTPWVLLVLKAALTFVRKP